MRLLKTRIAHVGTAHADAMGGYQPVTGSNGSPAGPQTMPLSQVLIYPSPAAGGQYATVAYRGLAPVWTPDGAAIPASAPAGWGQLRAAGRP